MSPIYRQDSILTSFDIEGILIAVDTTTTQRRHFEMQDSPIAWMMAGGVRADGPDDARHRRAVADTARTPTAWARSVHLDLGRIRTLLAAPVSSVESPALDCCPA
jgi:hypothetical protein